MSSRYAQIAATRLRAEMGIRQMTQRSLADSLGVSAPKAAKLINGQSWNLDDVDRVAELLGITGAELLGSPLPVWSKATPEQLDAPLVFPSRVDRRDSTPLAVPDDEAVAA